MKDLKGAVEDYEKSLELDPDNEITYNNLGLALEQMGAMARAQRMYKKGNEILGYDPEKRVMDESGDHMVNKDEIEPQQETEVDPKEEKKALRKKKGKAAKEVFSNKNAFKEFLGFIGNGFKLKDSSDKSEEQE